MNEFVHLLEDFVNNNQERNVLYLFGVLFILDTVFGLAWRFQRQKSDKIPILNSGAFIGGFLRNTAYFGSAYFIIVSFADDGLSEAFKIFFLIGAVVFPTISILVNFELSTGFLHPMLKFLPAWAQNVMDSEKFDKEQTVADIIKRKNGKVKDKK